MEILDAGAFINLENQEKIDQLKYTATELAKAALETNGFVNEEEPARNLALDFWQGLEYMCRETERGAIQNIFVGQFLDYLKDLRLPVVLSENPSTDQKSAVVSNPAHQPNPTEDEFLGVLSAENQVPEILVNQEENQVIPILTDDSPPIAQVPAENDAIKEQTEVSLPLEPQSESPQSTGTTGASNQNTDFRDNEVESEEFDTDEIETEEAEGQEEPAEENKITAAADDGGLTLAEKEPYQFNKCTVTATVQLLPVAENSDLRRVVLSVRTHDFAPDILLVEIPNADLTAALGSELEKVLALYQTDLPFKVINKMKKEKTAKQKTRPATETKTAITTTNPKQATTTANIATKVTAASSTSSPPPPPAADTGGGVQGTLFGF